MRELRTAVIAIVAMTIVLGIAYPLAMTGVAQVAFPSPADGKTSLIGKDHSNDASLFQSRPSVTHYAPDATSFNNQGPNQRALAEQLGGYVAAYLKREGPFTPGLTAARIPADAVTTSASGIDPSISLRNARIQANRVARQRGLPLDRVLKLIDDHGGRETVNVNDLNAALRGTAR